MILASLCSPAADILATFFSYITSRCFLGDFLFSNYCSAGRPYHDPLIAYQCIFWLIYYGAPGALVYYPAALHNVNSMHIYTAPRALLYLNPALRFVRFFDSFRFSTPLS